MSWDPEVYEAEQAHRMRAARLRKEAYSREWHGKWAEERAKNIGQRQHFAFAEIGAQLACDPLNLVIDPELQTRVEKDLAGWVQNRQFVTGEVAWLGDDPPDFRPFHLSPGNFLVADPEALCLSRNACHRYVSARIRLLGAANLLRDWFSEPKSPPMTSSESKPVDETGIRTRTLPRPKLPAADARKWYVEYVQKCEKAGTEPSEQADWTEAKLKFGDKIRRNQVRDLRRKFAPTAWRKQGRRPSKDNSAKNSAE
jgi:hypothetical protein